MPVAVGLVDLVGGEGRAHLRVPHEHAEQDDEEQLEDEGEQREMSRLERVLGDRHATSAADTEGATMCWPATVL